MIHRDLKPDNIFFDLNDCKTIKIGDFGIAATHDGTAAASHTGST
jgi:serine/threonine protein kinase